LNNLTGKGGFSLNFWEKFPSLRRGKGGKGGAFSSPEYKGRKRKFASCSVGGRKKTSLRIGGEDVFEEIFFHGRGIFFNEGGVSSFFWHEGRRQPFPVEDGGKRMKGIHLSVCWRADKSFKEKKGRRGSVFPPWGDYFSFPGKKGGVLP